MLPSVVSREVISAIQSQLRAQFPSTTTGFSGSDGSNTALIDGLTGKDGSLFKGPYLSFGLPFRTASPDEALPFEHIDLPYAPYAHQFKAFQRLTGPSPLPTLVATGTGSGKTECFMYPILEHCITHPGPGVKSIIVYPMNALAQDQARRFAEEIYSREAMRGNIRVGLFTGDSETTRHKTMTADSVITCKTTQRETPPDILLTNYKMLDYLLIRPRDRALWRFNEPETMRFLVVDELHTFDGAQGTDLACLIRRLKDRLAIGDTLACVGTSATVGEETEALVEYASEVFDQPFTSDSVLREERIDAATFLAAPDNKLWPDAGSLAAFADRKFGDVASYLREAQVLWSLDVDGDICSVDNDAAVQARNALATKLKSLKAFHEILGAHSTIADASPLAREWSVRLRVDTDTAMAAVSSLVALASVARSGSQPMLTVRAQLWARELRRLVASVSPDPILRFSDDLSPDAQKAALHLPVLHCNQCHAIGWISTKHPARSELVRELRPIYESFFNDDPDTCVLYPASDEAPDRPHRIMRLCSSCGALNSSTADQCSQCEAGGEDLIAVLLPNMNRDHRFDGGQVRRFHRDCPYCESRGSLLIMGSRAAPIASVAIDRIFNSRFNSDPKLIAFSDSVQDAAHRAGFFEARTYKQVVRQAMAGSVQLGSHNTLSELIDGFGNEWREWFTDNGRRDEDFAGTFIAPDLEWLRDWEALQLEGQLPRRSNLIEHWIQPRLRWEVISEFGLRSRLGRTLERSGVAVPAPSQTILDQAVRALLPMLREHFAELADLSEPDLRRFLLGVLWRLRTRGGFYDGELEPYLARGGDDFMLRRRQYLPPFGRQTPKPMFLTLMRQKGFRFDCVLGSDNATWYQNWFTKTLAAGNVFATDLVGSVYERVLQQLSGVGRLLNQHVVERHGQPTSVWTLDPAQWTLSTSVATLACNRCRNPVQVAEDEIVAWSGAACIRSQCAGQLDVSQLPDAKPDPPSQLSPPVRLITAEHTAVLDGTVRDQVERSFKATPGETWDVNLLSATPTMEMGVDIGALSSVLLCSVPPAQANYLQRIGRAGRKDGNAFNFTIANGIPHDLYFYAEPLEMMRGEVQPPGMFLGAIAVLDRQLVAYCLDQWVKSGIEDDAIPAKLGQALNSVERGDSDKFPQNFLRFVDNERGRISRDFVNLFPKLPSQGIDQLQGFLYGEYGGRPGITFRVSNLLQQKVQQRANLRSDIDHLKRELDRLAQQPKDEATEATISEIQAERNGLMRLVRRLNEQYTLNFLTDEGLLPNYAFPEEGVKLSAVIYRRREVQQDDDGSAFERIEFEIRRPAHAALRELAPFSRFYGNSRHVEIDQIEIRSSAPEEWRLCNRCNYAEHLVTGDEHSSCPRCGGSGWIASTQKQTLLRLKEVYAFASDRDSRIGDDSDDREPVFFRRQHLFDVEELPAEHAHRIDDPIWPFGFEYRPAATMREVNFGKEANSGPDLEIAGETANRSGFTVCRHCGKVRKFRARAEDNHTRRCPMRTKDKDEQLENSYPNLYLYRELRSEAVRLLLPFAEVAQSPVRLQSFIAALYFGMKLHFRGNVGHLQVTHYSEPVGASDLRRQYLVIMDSVPGGTGYLRELLSSPDNIKNMLQQAYTALEDCSCRRDPDKDGCYRCLYAYRDSYRLSDTSRRSALETIGNLLDRWDQLIELPADESLDHTDVNALFDSELERLFIEVIGNFRGCSLQAQHINGKPCYTLAVKSETSGQTTRWTIEPQVELGAAQGVSVMSRCDFLMRCLSDDSVLPIALFLDGFEYHRDIANLDSQKRFAILQSRQYRVWSLGWKDLPRPDYQPPAHLVPWLDQPRHKEGAALHDSLAQRLKTPSFAQLRHLVEKPAFTLLVALLSAPVSMTRILEQLSLSRVFGLVDQTASQSPDETLQRVGTWLPGPWQDRYWQPPLLLGDNDLESGGRVKAVVSIPQAALGDGTFANHASICIRIDDRDNESDSYNETWQRFWSAANVFQFLGNFLPASVKGIEAGLYAPIIEASADADRSKDDLRSAAWVDALDLSDPRFADSLVWLEQNGLPAPEIGTDIANNQGEVVATLEWAWNSQKVGFGELSPVDADLLRTMDWVVVTDLTPESLDTLKVALSD